MKPTPTHTRYIQPALPRRAILQARLILLLHDDRGQALPLIAVLMTVLLGMAALSVDVGREMYTHRELQAVTDAAALAGARAIPTASTSDQITGATGVVATYSAAPNGWNQRTTLPSVTVSSVLKCYSTLQAQGIPCVGAVPYNAVQVTQSSTLTMYFAGVLGHRTQVITTVATASARGGAPRPSNIAIVIDSTLSMNQYDTNCGATQMQCALNGVQVLLQNIPPCGVNQGTCTTLNSFDRVSVFTFPNVTVGTASIDYSCTTPIPAVGYTLNALFGAISLPPQPAWSGIPTAAPYSFPTAGATSYTPSGSSTPTYQITPYLNDFRTSAASTSLNSNSYLVKAAGGSTGCGSMLPSNYDGVVGTYYAGAIYAAQASLVAEQAAYPSADNVMIILGDGDSHAPGPGTNYGWTVFPSPASASGYYPSWNGQCGQAITAANAATTAGTRVYTVAYGASSSGCSYDVGYGSNPGVSPCNAMYYMASAPQNFYSDYQQTGSNSTCYSSQPYTSLNSIFAAIANDLSQARLIPNNTT